MFCPKCKAEYVPGYTRCSDCLVPLVDALPETERKARKRTEPSAAPAEPRRRDPPSEPLKLVTVLATGDTLLMAVAKSLLQSAQIPFTVKGEGLGEVLGIGRIGGGFNPISGPMELQVRDEDAEDARLLLADLSVS